MTNLLQIREDHFHDILGNAELVHKGLNRAGSQVTISGPVTDQNRDLWKYLKTKILYRSTLQRGTSEKFIVEDNPIFAESKDEGRLYGTMFGAHPVTWTDESQIDLDLYYKVKLTLQPGQLDPEPEVTSEMIRQSFRAESNINRLLRMPIDKLRRMCSSMKLATTGQKNALVGRLHRVEFPL